MNKKQLNSIAKIARCIKCGVGKYVLRTYTAIPIITMDETAKCCDDPRYYWDWETCVLCEFPIQNK